MDQISVRREVVPYHIIKYVWKWKAFPLAFPETFHFQFSPWAMGSTRWVLLSQKTENLPSVKIGCNDQQLPVSQAGWTLKQTTAVVVLVAALLLLRPRSIKIIRM